MPKTAAIILTCCVMLAAAAPARARTTCEVKDGEIVVTVYIAFRNVKQPLVDRWVKEIIDVWNGPKGHQVYGPCNHRVRFEVVHKIIPRNSRFPKGYHAVDVVRSGIAEKSLPRTPDGRHTIAYMGRTTRSPSVRGASIDGVWSTRSSAPVNPRRPRGERFKDAAHEVGHMMGLGDDYDHKRKHYGKHLMGSTSGPHARVTPELVVAVVEAITGKNYCPVCPPPWEQPPVEPVDEKNLQPGLSYTAHEGNFHVLPDFAAFKGGATGTVAAPTSTVSAKRGFAAVFTGYLHVPKDACYTFHLRSDDGSRLEIAGRVIASNDGKHGMWTKRGMINLKAGKHPIRIGYFNAGGGSGLELRYSADGVAKQIIPASAYYHKPASASPSEDGSGDDMPDKTPPKTDDSRPEADGAATKPRKRSNAATPR